MSARWSYPVDIGGRSRGPPSEASWRALGGRGTIGWLSRGGAISWPVQIVNRLPGRRSSRCELSLRAVLASGWLRGRLSWVVRHGHGRRKGRRVWYV